MPDVYLHIGLHKTATTTLQRQVFPGCDGLNYLGAVHDVNGFIQAALNTDPIYYDADHHRSLITAHMRDDMPNLISNESFSGPLYVGVGKAGLDHRSSILDNLKATLPEARIILVIRRQDGLARSIYRQYLKVGGVEPIHRFYGLRGDRSPIMPLNRFRFSPYVDRLVSLFPAGVLVLTFEEFIKNQGSFLSRLAQFLGTDLPDKELLLSNQTRLGPAGMEFSRLCNRVFRSRLNPGGLLPGIPRYRSGKFSWVSPTMLMHGGWPIRAKPKETSDLYRIGTEILSGVREDNRELDQRFNLGLENYGYY